MRRAWLAPTLALLLIDVACGGEETSIDVGDGGPSFEAGRGGRGGRGGSSGSEAGRGGSGGSDDRDGGPPDAGTDPAAPQITIVSPAAADDPNEDDIITEPTVRVRCRVGRGLDPAARNVDQSSIAITLVGSADPAQMPITGSITALPDNEYEAEFSVSHLANGPLRFACSAADVGMPPLASMATVETFLDLGPTITILEPIGGSRHALRNPVLIKFQVEPNPVSADDEEADISAMRLEVLGLEVIPDEDPDQEGLFTTSVNFNDKIRFPMAPSTAEIIVTATNSRTPLAPTRRVDANIEIDADGPSIVVMSPANLQIVRGNVELVVNVTDPSGIQAGSLTGTINGTTYALDDWDIIAANVYREQFDTRAQLFNNRTQLTINITADDTVGNRSSVSHSLKLDNVPPILSLDPPFIRETRDNNGAYECSVAFDPLGDAANDLQAVAASSLYRVLVEDRTNVSEGSVTDWHAGVNPGSMRLYAQEDEAIPLLVDTDADGTCDNVNFETLPTIDRPVELTLSPVEDRGASWFSPTPDFASSLEHTARVECVAGVETNPPPRLCPNTPMTRAVPQGLESAPPAVYAFAPMMNMSTCAGDSWELVTAVGEGWACLAARVEDNIGNIGVSPPIRVCITDGAPNASTCPEAPPDCTDGCTWPPDFPPNTHWAVH